MANQLRRVIGKGAPGASPASAAIGERTRSTETPARTGAALPGAAPLVAYVAGIAAVNIGFVYVPLVDVAGIAWPPMSLAVGFLFVLRDYAQRAAGHWVLAGMAAGCALSYLMASPYVALASAAAFAISELADWALYTWSRRPFAQRVLLSSAISTPVDSVVFLGMIGFLSPAAALLMTASKIVGAVAVWWRAR